MRSSNTTELSPSERRNVLLRLLEAGSVRTADEAARRLGVSRRTVQYDIAALRKRGHQLLATRGRAGGLAATSLNGRDGGDASGRFLILDVARPNVPLSMQTRPILDVLTAATIVGERFSIRELFGILDGITEQEVLERLTLAGRDRLVVRDPDRTGGFTFSSPHIREEILSQADPSEFVRLNLRYASWLERNSVGRDRPSQLTKIAEHFSNAYPVDEGKAAEYSLLAAEALFSKREYALAEVQYERVIETSDDKVQSARAIFGKAKCLDRQLDRRHSSEVWELLTDAFRTFVELGDVDSAMKVLNFAPAGFVFQRGTVEFVREAIPIVSGQDRGLVLSRLASATFWDLKDVNAALSLSTEALAALEDGHADEPTLQALANHCLFLIHSCDYDKALEVARKIDRLSSSGNWAYFPSPITYLICGAFNSADESVARLEATAPSAPNLGFWNPVLRGSLLFATGSSDIAEGDLHPAHRAVLFALRGDRPRAKVWISEALNDLRVTDGIGVRAGLGLCLAISEYLLGSTEFLPVIRTLITESEDWTPLFDLSIAAASVFCDLADEHQPQQEVASALDRGSGRISLHSGLPFDLISALVAARNSQWEISADLLRAVDSQLSRYPKSPWRLLALLELARLAFRPRTGVTPSVVREISDDARNLCRELGFRSLERSFSSLVNKANNADAQESSGNVFGITHREVEVMGLLAGDLTDTAIGERLAMSVHTVRAHIRNAMNKTDSKTRGAAIGRLVRADLI